MIQIPAYLDTFSSKADKTAGIRKECKTCHKEYFVRKNEINQKYCSSLCYGQGIAYKKINSTCIKCKIIFVYTPIKWRPIRKYCSRKCSKQNNLGKKYSEERKNKISISNKIAYTDKNRREVLSRRMKERIERGEINTSGANNVNWKGGVTPENLRIRNSAEMKLWRKTIFERDNYTCVICKQYGGRLSVDHIKPFSLYPELRFDLSNGRTVCWSCHLKLPTSKLNGNITREQYVEVTSLF